MAASISPGAKRKIPVPNETGKFQEKSLDFSPRQGKYNTILDNLSIGRNFPKQNCTLISAYNNHKLFYTEDNSDSVPGLDCMSYSNTDS